MYFSENAIQRHRGAYFVNKHNTLWKELTFLFPEHQKFSKSIKKSPRKLKKSEKHLKNLEFFENFRKSRFFQKISIENRIEKIEIFENFRYFLKNHDFFENFSDFFIFWDGFFMDFIFFDVLESWSSALSKKYYVYLRNMLHLWNPRNPSNVTIMRYFYLWNCTLKKNTAMSCHAPSQRTSRERVSVVCVCAGGLDEVG